MTRKILLAIMTLTNSSLLVLMIALGSQNLSDSHKISFGPYTTKEAYPSGFTIGISTILGSISGGLSTLLLLPSSTRNFS